MVSTVMLGAAGAIAALMITTWLISLVITDVSIVDLIWGLGFVIVAWVSRFLGDGLDARQNLLVALTTVWGLRLSGYLAKRNIGSGEDFRYVKMRERYGQRFRFTSLFIVFGLQGLIMYAVSVPVQWGQTDPTPDLGLVALLGVIVWAVGFAFESVGDYQLARFKARPDSAGQVMDQGLWGWTRHPNYFGDACVWWGLGLIAAETGGWRIASFIGPAVMTLFLTRISGRDLLEKSLKKRRPGYAEYVRTTSGFFPRPPRRA
jgi:steroid 5-alpha reductase family enzyme